MNRWIYLPVRRPGVVLLASLALTLVLGTRLVDPRTGELRLGLDPAVARMLPDADEAGAFFDQQSHRFGTRETLIVALVSDDLFTQEGLASLARVTRRLESLPSVKSVLSLANALDIRSVDGDIWVQPFLAVPPTSAAEVAAIRHNALRNPIYAGSLVSRDGNVAVLLARLRPVTDREFMDQEIDRKLLAAARDAAGPGVEVLITGLAHVKAETTRRLLSSLQTVLPVAGVLLLGISAAVFRSVIGVVATLVTVGVALVWTSGLLAWAGVSLNLVTAIVPPLLLAIGFAYAVHTVTAWQQIGGEDPDEVAEAGGAVGWALRHVALPVALTGLTTVAGFAALLLSPFPAVREFGWISMLGVALTVAASLGLTPALLQFFGRTPAQTVQEQSVFDTWMERLGRVVVGHRRVVLAGGAALGLLSVAGIARIQINTDVISNFRPDAPVRRHVEQINAALEGANPFSIVIHSSQRDAFAQPENLHAIEALQTWLAAQPEVGGSSSLVDYVKLLHRALRDEDPEAFAVPNNPRLVKQLLLFGASDDLEGFVNGNYSTVRIAVRSKTVDSRDLARLLERLAQRLAELPGHLEPTVTGNAVLLTRTVDEVARGQLETLGAAFFFIFAVLVGLFTSFRVGLVALIPNALPVLLYFGMLGWLGIGLNITNGLLACMILGIAVDDTIHFLTRFNAEARERVDEKTGAVRALRYVGRPVTITTAALCLGFLALLSSDLRSQAEFGLLGAVTLAFAWLVDVTFTPALCSGMRIVTLWDALSFDLGRDPHLSIPVFHGLSKTQARIVALTTNVIRIPAGERIMHAGEPGDSLYVVIEGELVVSLETARGRVEFARCQRGDTIGEVGLYYGKRTADVDVVTDVRALRFTRANLERLRSRYPRIGARVFWNLSEILADRVANTTAKVA